MKTKLTLCFTILFMEFGRKGIWNLARSVYTHVHKSEYANLKRSLPSCICKSKSYSPFSSVVANTWNNTAPIILQLCCVFCYRALWLRMSRSRSARVSLPRPITYLLQCACVMLTHRGVVMQLAIRTGVCIGGQFRCGIAADSAKGWSTHL